ncbi:MAG: cellulase family glycosylhydrolase [Roseateles sp.]
MLSRSALSLAVALMAGCGGGGSAAAAVSASSTPAAPVVPAPATAACTNATTVMPHQSGSALPFCASLSADPDGDGQGSEGGKACQMRTGFDITAAMGAGWNLGNTLDATGQTADTLADETAWGNPRTTQAIIDAIKKAGFSSLRLPVSWDDHVTGSGWTIHKAWLDRVDEITGYALAAGMTVIVNIHHNGDWGAPTLANEARAADVLGKLWPQIAQRFEK